MKPARTRRSGWMLLVAILLAVVATPGLGGPPPSPPDEPGQAESVDATAPTDDGAEVSEPAVATPGPAGHAGAARSATLRVVVTGQGQPIHLAEVQVTQPTEHDDRPPRFTDERGAVTFNSTVLGKAKVRVIARDWQSALREITLVAGTQTLTIDLRPLQ